MREALRLPRPCESWVPGDVRKGPSAASTAPPALPALWLLTPTLVTGRQGAASEHKACAARHRPFAEVLNVPGLSPSSRHRCSALSRCRQQQVRPSRWQLLSNRVSSRKLQAPACPTRARSPEAPAQSPNQYFQLRQHSRMYCSQVHASSRWLLPYFLPELFRSLRKHCLSHQRTGEKMTHVPPPRLHGELFWDSVCCPPPCLPGQVWAANYRNGLWIPHKGRGHGPQNRQQLGTRLRNPAQPDAAPGSQSGGRHRTAGCGDTSLPLPPLSSWLSAHVPQS